MHLNSLQRAGAWRMTSARRVGGECGGGGGGRGEGGRDWRGLQQV